MPKTKDNTTVIQDEKLTAITISITPELRDEIDKIIAEIEGETDEQ